MRLVVALFAAFLLAGCGTASPPRPRLWLSNPQHRAVPKQHRERPRKVKIAGKTVSYTLASCVSTDCGAYSITLNWDVIALPGRTGYNIFVNGTQVGTTTAAVYTFTGMDCGTTFTLGVQAHDSSSGTSQTYSTSYTTPACGGGLPTGVTLQAIDGGSCSSSGGPCSDNYYCSNGFTNACNSGASYPAKSWDDPTFFPIGQDYYGCTASLTPYLNEKLNVLSRLNSDCTPTGSTAFGTIAHNNGLWVLAGSDQYTDSPDCQSTGFGAETVGWHVDEPVTWNQTVASDCAAMAQPNPSLTAASTAFNNFTTGGLTGRFMAPVWTANEYPNAPYTSNKVATGANSIPSSCGTPTTSVLDMQDIFSCTSGMAAGRRPFDVATLDTYWFAGSGSGSLAPNYAGYCSDLYGSACSTATADKVGRASNYGDAIDAMRAWTSGSHIPGGVYLETGDGLAGTGARNITPAEFNWAAWEQIIHGARMLLYFTLSSNSSNAGFPTTSVGGTTMAAQGTATDGLVQTLAPIINSPFALSFASNNAGGYVFPTEHLALDNGLDMSVHYYTGSTLSNSAGTFGAGFYIVAAVRGSESQTTPVTATFTLPSTDSTPTGSIQDVCACSPTQSTGTVSYSASTHSFSETFSSVSDVHIIGPFQ